jgi:hypothetical protein
MTTELWLLAGSVLLALVQIGLASTAAKRVTGIASAVWTGRTEISWRACHCSPSP